MWGVWLGCWFQQPQFRSHRMKGLSGSQCAGWTDEELGDSLYQRIAICGSFWTLELCERGLANAPAPFPRALQGIIPPLSTHSPPYLFCLLYCEHHHLRSLLPRNKTPMAHQASSIPWNVLASNLLWSEAKHPGHGDLHLRFKPEQGKQLNYFVEGFVRNIREHASTSRQKYPTHHDPPHPDAVILDDATVSKIAPTVRRWRAQLQRWHNDIIFNRERGESQVPIPIPVPDEERRASAFYRSYRENPCYSFFRVNGEAFFNLELVKTLLLYGEMDVLFSVCAHPGVDLRTWWSKGRCPCSVRRSLVALSVLTPDCRSHPTPVGICSAPWPCCHTSAST